MSKHDNRFPGESNEYRKRRDELLDAEVELRRQVETVAAKRRQLPLGGEIPQDYEFDTERGPRRISEMFRDGKDTLVLYSFMYGPQMDEPCPY